MMLNSRMTPLISSLCSLLIDDFKGMTEPLTIMYGMEISLESS